MKTIGLIGGISWQSSIEYYRLANELTGQKLGGLHSAKLLMYSIEFGKFSEQERLAGRGYWKPLNTTMIDAARRLKCGGADFVVIASNTMNSCADDIEAQVGIPVLRIMDCTGAKIKKSDITTVALIGTKYTMEAGFYKDRLEQGYGLKVVVPDEPDRDYINEILFDELCFGKKCSRTRERIVGIIDSMVDEKGAEGVILGCTELPLLLGQKDIAVPVFDTMQIHVEAAVDYAVKGS